MLSSDSLEETLIDNIDEARQAFDDAHKDEAYCESEITLTKQGIDALRTGKSLAYTDGENAIFVSYKSTDDK